MASESVIEPLTGGGGRRRLLGDRRLARAAGAGDEAAFTELYRRHGPALYRYCASMLGEHDAADALQSAMTKAFASLRRDGAPEEPKPWLYRIAHNESIDILRDRRSRAALDMAVEQASGAPIFLAAGPAEESEAKQRFRRLLADIHSLPERQRGALLMRELSGLSSAEIASALGTSEATAKQAVYEARTALTEIEQGREMSCERVQRALSDGDRRVLRGRQVRAHLRDCERCQAFEAAITERGQALNAFTPVLPALAAGTILQQVLGGAAAGGGAAAAGAAAGAGGSVALGGLVAKVAAVSAATAAIGFGGYEGLRSAGVVGSGEPDPPPAEQEAPPSAGDGEGGGADEAAGEARGGGADREARSARAGSDRAPSSNGSGGDRAARPGSGSADVSGGSRGSNTGERSDRGTGAEQPARQGRGRPQPGEDRSNRGGNGAGAGRGGGSAASSNSNRGGAARGSERAGGRRNGGSSGSKGERGGQGNRDRGRGRQGQDRTGRGTSRSQSAGGDRSNGRGGAAREKSKPDRASGAKAGDRAASGSMSGDAA